MNDRIKKVRRHVTINLSQEDFGAKLGVTGAAISRLESGARNPSDQIILSVCREFGVNETWLRTGVGNMFIKKTRAQEIDEFISDIMKGEPDFRQQLVSLLARMTPEEWKLLEKKAYELLDEMKKTSPQSTEDAEEAYRKSLGYAPSRESSALNISGGTERNTDIKIG